MLETIADPATMAWPLALTCATVVAADRVRAGRRRERLNRGLHELRRPLQALLLEPAPPGDRRRGGETQLELALDALAGLDREINGTEGFARRRRVDGGALLEDARVRWRRRAQLAGRRIDVAGRAGGASVICDPAAIARALDNLIANALEHGSGTIGLESVSRSGRLRLVVVDGGARTDGCQAGDNGGAGGVVGAGGAGGATRPFAPLPRHAHRLGGVGPTTRRAPSLERVGGRRRDPRRGHGLRVVAQIAAEHGGRFVACRDRAGASAVLELPLAEG